VSYPSRRLRVEEVLRTISRFVPLVALVSGRRFYLGERRIHTQVSHNAKSRSFTSRNTLILLQVAEEKEGSGEVSVDVGRQRG
jgi:hypothetical protein